MNKLLVILCAIGIVSNVYFGVLQLLPIGGRAPAEQPGEEEGEDHGPVTIPSVIVPEGKLKETVRYDNEIFVQTYWLNKTDGSWERYTLTANGQLQFKTFGAEVEDGFGEVHSTVCTQLKMVGVFTLYVEENDTEPITVHGDFDSLREEYQDLNAQVVIKIVTSGDISVEQLPSANIPLSFSGWMYSYPNPNIPMTKTLEELIYGDSKELKLGDEGNISKTLEYEDYNESWNYTYNWKVERAERVAGYDTFMINITTTFFEEWLPFNERLWVSNEVPIPVEMYTHTNESEDDENYTFYMVFETTRVLQSYSEGEQSIPWGTCDAAHHFITQHPDGEYCSWDYMPLAGQNYDSSSFEFKPEEAVSCALQSAGLQNFIAQYGEDNIVISGASYNKTESYPDPQERAGIYEWELRFGYKPRAEAWEDEEGEDHYWKYEYNIIVEREVVRQISGYEYGTPYIKEDVGRVNGSAALSRSQMKQKMLSLASSEQRLLSDETVKNEVVSPITNNISFEKSATGKDTTYGFIVGGITLETLPGMNLLQTLIGFSFPTFNTAWSVQKGTLLENGETFMAGVDAETGQYLYVTNIEGSVLMNVW